MQYFYLVEHVSSGKTGMLLKVGLSSEFKIPLTFQAIFRSPQLSSNIVSIQWEKKNMLSM